MWNWKHADGSLRHSSNSSGMLWGMVPSTGWGCCCWHSRNLGSEMLREDAGPQASGCRQCLIPALEAGAGKRGVHAYRRYTLIEEMCCPF